MAVGSTYIYGLGLTESIYLYNVTQQFFYTDNNNVIVDIGTASETYSLIVNYTSGGDTIGLSSSSSAYVPVSSYKITQVLYGSSDTPTTEAVHTDNDFIIETRSAYLYIKITVEPVASLKQGIKLGSNQINAIKLGSVDIAKTYKGSDLIWEKSSSSNYEFTQSSNDLILNNAPYTQSGNDIII